MSKRQPSRRSALCRSGRPKRRGRPIVYKVKLNARDRKKLNGLMARGQESVRVLKRTRLLQLLSEGKTAEAAAAAVGTGLNTALRVRQRYATDGLERALRDRPRPGRERAIKPNEEPHLVAMLCGPSPKGRARWTIRLATEEARKRGIVKKASRGPIHAFITNRGMKPWREKNVVHPEADTGVLGKDGGRSQGVREAGAAAQRCAGVHSGEATGKHSQA